jgi:hypothetical protein
MGWEDHPAGDYVFKPGIISPANTNTNTNTNMQTPSAPVAAAVFPLSIIKQAIAVCFVEVLNLVPVLWGPVGWTKSATIKGLADDLGLPLFDVRLSDKEPTDLGGIPYPVDKTIEGQVVKVLSYLANALLPWEEIYGATYECILFFDELDRTSIDVLNVALQILLDKGVNGRKLCPKCHIICAGNGSTDSGTTELSKAAATRLVHFYVDTQGSRSLDHWVDWAGRSGVHPSLAGYARFRPAIFGGPKPEYIEQQQPNPRTFTWAAAALDLLGQTQLEPEVGDAIVFGLVGQVAGREYTAYRTVLANCATFEEVVRDPAKAKLPPADQVGVLYALGEAFLIRLFDSAQTAKNLSPELNPKHTALVAAYFARCVSENPACREAVAWFFRIAGTKLPSLPGLAEYKAICS